MLLSTVAVLALCVPQLALGVTWDIHHGVDNNGNHDITVMAQRDVPSLKKACLARTYCAGFSVTFGTLKYSLADLGEQDNTDLYVRQPPPPPLPTPPPFNVWPMPAKWSAGTASALFDNSSFSFASTGHNSSVLSKALKRYRGMLCPVRVPLTTTSSLSSSFSRADTSKVNVQSSQSETITGCNVKVLSSGEELIADMDEAYTLRVPTSGRVEIVAQTVWGALRGLETLSQLIVFDWTGECSFSPALPLEISDVAQKPYRALMIDTSRHFLPMSVILQHLDAMSAAKLNVLHWHVSDDPSFPLYIPGYEALATNGAYDTAHATYSTQQAKDIVQYAYERGIRVIPEFDMPGHATSWMKSYPWLQGTASCAVFDITLDTTYSFIDGFVGAVTTIFPDAVVHLGGDEVNYACLNDSATIRAYMAAHNYTMTNLTSMYVSRVNAIVKSHGRQLQLWDDMYSNGAVIPEEVAVEVWGGGLDKVSRLLKSRHDVIYSQPFYLDNLSQAWSDFYSQQIEDSEWTPTERLRMLGSSASMWGESVDATNAFPRVWPRATALSELLWSSSETPFIAQVQATRLRSWRCRMLQRGLRPEPVGPYNGCVMYCGPL